MKTKQISKTLSWQVSHDKFETAYNCLAEDNETKPCFQHATFKLAIPSILYPYCSWTGIYYQMCYEVDLGAVLSIIAGHLVGYENLFCSKETDSDLRATMHRFVCNYDFNGTYDDIMGSKHRKTVVAYPSGHLGYMLEIKPLPKKEIGSVNPRDYDFEWVLGCGPKSAPVPYGEIWVDFTFSEISKRNQTEEEKKQFATAHSLYLSILGSKGNQLGSTAQEQMLKAAIEAGTVLGMLSPMKIY
jgi:hypothetical protein